LIPQLTLAVNCSTAWLTAADGVPDPGLEPVQVIHPRYATQIRYRLGRPAYYRS